MSEKIETPTSISIIKLFPVNLSRPSLWTDEQFKVLKHCVMDSFSKTTIKNTNGKFEAKIVSTYGFTIIGQPSDNSKKALADAERKATARTINHEVALNRKHTTNT